MNPTKPNNRTNLKKALTLALVSAFVLQPFTPIIALAANDTSVTVVGQTYSYGTPGSDTWTVPANVTSVKVKVWGAGGSAGTGEKITDAHRSGQGGGAGGYSEKTLTVTPGDVYSLVVGAGGQGIKSTIEGRVGNEGTETRFEGSFGFIRATGGQGGASFMGHGNPTSDLGFGGYGEGGDVNSTGNNGAPYTEVDGNPYASNGGSAINGGQGGSRGRCGRDGTCPGSEPGSPWATDGGFPGGGGGGSDVATGGYGANGQVLIEVVSITPPVVVNPPVTNPTAPVGYIDSANCTAVTGWTYDKDNSSASINVHFYTDINSVHTFFGDTVANVPRPDVNQADGITGNHGFSYAIPADFLDGGTHLIYAYGIDSNGGTVNTRLGNSPLQISGCTPPAGGGGGVTVNRAPLAPTVTPVDGTGAVNVNHTFTAVTTDPELNNVDYGFDWDNDGTVDAYTGLVPSGTSVQMAHSWPTEGTYPVRVSVRDTFNAYSPVTVVQFRVTASGGGGTVNTAPNLPALIAAPLTGVVNTPVQFSVVASDPQNDDISYGFDWNNNGTNIEYTALTHSGISAEISHTWSTAGTYTFAVTARDSHNLSSGAITHTIVVSVGGGGGVITNPVANITSFYVTPTAIQSGDTATLTWTSVNTSSCVASGDWSGTQATSGVFPLGVQTATVSTFKTYTLTCSNQFGQSVQSATLRVDPATGGGGGPITPVPAISSFEVTPGTITSGSGAVLSWASTGATLCEAGGAWTGYQSMTGSAPILPGPVTVSTNLVYTLSCGNGVSTTTRSTTLTVLPATGGGGGTVVTPPTIDFTVSPASGLVTTESGSTATFAVALTSAPSANVVLPILSSNFAEGTTSVTSLTFTPANWNLAQIVTVTGRDDALVDGNVSYMISVGASVSTDSVWNGLAAKTVGVINTDNEPPVVVPPTGGGSTGGGGGTTHHGGGGGGGPCVGFGCSSSGTTTTSINSDLTIVFDDVVTTTGSSVSGPELVCPSVNFITVFMRKGIDNNPNEVRKLQYFLNTYEGANLTIDGDFNDQTEAAVMMLQSNHSAQILAPWGVTAPTGIVYITTARYINRVFCSNHPTYSGNGDIKDIIDGSIPNPTIDNSGQFDGAIGQATSTPTSSNIAGVFGAFSQKLWDFLKDIPWYQLLILLLILIGTGLMINGVFRKDIGSHDYFMSFIRGGSALAIGTVLNVLNAVSFILNPDWFTDKAGFGLGWLLALDIVNLLALIVICIAILLALYGRVTKNEGDISKI